MHLNKLLRGAFRFVLLGITHKIVRDSFCLIHFGFRWFSFTSLLEQSWKWVSLGVKMGLGVNAWFSPLSVLQMSRMMFSFSALSFSASRRDRSLAFCPALVVLCDRHCTSAGDHSSGVCTGSLRPDVYVVLEPTAPPPSFHVDVVGRHWRKEPDFHGIWFHWKREQAPWAAWQTSWRWRLLPGLLDKVKHCGFAKCVSVLGFLCNSLAASHFLPCAWHWGFLLL